MTEEWREVAGTNGVYEVSNLGRLRSWTILKKGGLLGQFPSRTGYLSVSLHSGGQVTRRAVHRVVAEAFHGPRPAGLVIRHLDGDRTNNRCDNLAYGTASENVRDSIRHGTFRNGEMAKTRCPQGHPYTEDNIYWEKGGRARRCRKCHNRKVVARRTRKQKEAKAA